MNPSPPTAASQPAPSEPGIVHALRGPFVENRHTVSVAVCAPSGTLLASCRDPSVEMVLRSTAKPFQALPLFHTGAVDRWDVSPAEIALACASHDATQEHVSAVGAWLARLEIGEEALGCGPHAPGHLPSYEALVRNGLAPQSIHNNCSGKHTGMLAACLAAGWSTHDYLAPSHPLQRAIHQGLERLSDGDVATGGVDGCSAPTFTLPLHRVARLYALLASPSSAPVQDVAGLSGAFEAMRAFPELVAGPTTIDTLLMQAFPNTVCKRGADGGYGIAARTSKLGTIGVGLWVHDGSGEARAAAVLSVLETLEVPPRSAAAVATLRDRFLVRRNCRNAPVGQMVATLGLTQVGDLTR